MTSSSSLRKGSSRGVAVVVVMFMLLLIVAFTSAVALLTKQNYTNADYNERVLKAKYAARAGMSVALEKLTDDPTWSPTSATPYTEMIDPGDGIGFEVWVEAINVTSNVPVTAPDGTPLAKGRAMLNVTPIVNGQKMVNALAGAEQKVLLVKAPVIFDDAILASDERVPLTLSGTCNIFSYDSTSGPPAVNGNPVVSPENTSATIRSMSNISLGSAVIHGTATLPTSATFNQGSGVLTGGPPVRTDDAYLLPKVEAPLGSMSTAVGASLDGTGLLAPGVYYDTSFPPGTTIRLQRGGTYVFWNNLVLGDNSTVELVGPVADGPVQLYAHLFRTGTNNRINMPADATVTAPRPEELQIYGISMVGCSDAWVDIEEDTEAALVALVRSGKIHLFDNARLFGAAIGQTMQLDSGSQLHYDLSLKGKELEANVAWSLVSQGR